MRKDYFRPNRKKNEYHKRGIIGIRSNAETTIL